MDPDRQSAAPARSGQAVSENTGAPPRRLVLIGALVLALAAFRYLHELAKLLVEAPFIDFGAFYAFTTALWQGVNPFDAAEMMRVDAVLGIRRAGASPTFTPAGYLVFLPMQALPYLVSRMLWLLVSQLSLAAAVVMLARRFQPGRLACLAGLVVVFGYQPIFEDFALGNLNSFVLLLLTLGVLATVRGRLLAASVPLSLAANLKPQYALLIPFMSWIGFPLTAALTLVFVVGECLLALAFLGWGWVPGYLEFLTVGSRGLHAWTMNLSPHAMLHRLVGSEGPAPVIDGIAIGASLTVIIAVMWATVRVDGEEGRLAAWATAIAALPLVSPLTEENHLVVLLIPMLFVIARLDRLPGRGDAALLVVATVLLASRYSVDSFSAFARGPASLAYGGKVLGAAALAVLAARLTRPEVVSVPSRAWL